MFRPEADVAGFVLALMIEPKRLETCLRRFLVKPTAWKNAPRRLDPQHGRSWSLIGNNVDLETGVLKVILVGLMNRAMMIITIMRQDK